MATALGLSTFANVEARRKKHRKRCRKIHQTCKPDGKNKRCCKNLSCIDETNDPDVGRCCRDLQAVCESESECCRGFTCQQAVNLVGNRCCILPGGGLCEEASDCCAHEFGSVGCGNNICVLSL